MIVDGVPRAPDGFDGWPFTTADGKHRIYRVRRDGAELLVLDGKEVARTDSILSYTYDDSSGRLAVVMKKGPGWVVSVDGREGKVYRRIDMAPRFSQDGRRVAYVATDSLTHVVVDGVPSRGYAQIMQLSVGFSRDGAHIAYLVAERGKMFWVLDGQEQKRYDRIEHRYGTPFRSDGLPLVYVVNTGNGDFVVSGTHEGERFDRVHGVFYGSREQIVYTARRGDQDFVVVNDSLYESARTTEVWGSTRTTALSLERGNGWYLVMNGVEFGPYDEAVRQVNVGGDGRRAFVAVRGGKHFAVIDGVEGPAFDWARLPTFSPDGRHVLYDAQRRDKWVIVADGEESPAYDRIRDITLRNPLNQLGGDSFGALVRRGDEDLRLTITWPRR